MATTYLTRTFGSVGNRDRWTFSAWVKKCANGTEQRILTTSDNSSFDDNIRFNSGDSLTVIGNGATVLTTNRLFRDNSAFYHIVVIWDSGNATSGDRCQLWVNGIRETSFATASYPSQNQDSHINNNTAHYIGVTNATANSNHFNGLMSSIYFIDGTAYDASAFGSTDATTGEWEANTSPSVTYGTNGFLILKDGNTITDQSSNSNDFTLGGGTLTNAEDNPDNVFATLNPLARRFNSTPNTFSNGNTTSTFPAASNSWNPVSATIGMTKGKWYWESKSISGTGTYNGMMAQEPTSNTGDVWLGGIANQFGYSGGNGYVYVANSNQASLSSYTNGDIVSVAYDADNNLIYFYKNGTIQNSGTGLAVPTPESTPLGAWFPAWSTWDTLATVKSFNFGNGYFGTTAIASEGTNASGIGKFEYDVPTGYTALSTKGLNS